MKYLIHLLKIKYYYSGGEMKWKILERRISNNCLHFLCKYVKDRDYAVFSFYLPNLTEKTIPSDKFTWGKKSGYSLFKEICEQDY